MKLNLNKGRPAAHRDIDLLEDMLDERLPASIVNFLSQYDGAEPETNIFKIGPTNESGVNGFIPVHKIIQEKRLLENLPQKAFPIAWAEGGNYVLIDLSADGAVFFWDHEQADAPFMLAKSFELFLSMLEPFDIKTIKVNPNQVKNAWIDPDFSKNLDDK